MTLIPDSFSIFPFRWFSKTEIVKDLPEEFSGGGSDMHVPLLCSLQIFAIGIVLSSADIVECQIKDKLAHANTGMLKL